MVLDLYWEDIDENEYKIASLEHNNEMYTLSINEQSLKNATHHGCFGIGECKFLMNKYNSKELFPFFKNRIPSSEHPRIDKILKKYNLDKYDEMELLRMTEGRLVTDRYYLKEKSI